MNHDEALFYLVLNKYLSGITGPTKIANAIGMPELAKDITQLLNTQRFMSAVHVAKRDMATSVVDAIKNRLHEFREKMEDLALNAGDPRVQFQALKDLMDRGGTGAAKQISLSSPASYKKALEEFTEVEGPDAKETKPTADPPTTSE